MSNPNRRTPHRVPPFKPHPLLALVTALGTSSLLANPQAPQVIQGQATFQQSGKSLTVTNSPGAIINWQQFNIDRGELTRFVQQSASSQVLNRVVGADPSAILGQLQSNGRVFLINPNGIVFGAGAQVDVGGLVASTLRLSNEDFNANRLRFTDTPGAGNIQNNGSIRTTTGAEVLLLAPRVENSGLIHAPDGKILLAAGRSVEVADIDKPNIRVEITNTEEVAVNMGTLMARHISIYGGLVRNSGRIQASSAVIGENGKVTLRAAQKVVLEPSSVIEATGSQGKTGGDIDISAQNALGAIGGGEVLVQGVLTVRPSVDAIPPNDVSKSKNPRVSIQLFATNGVANGTSKSSLPAGSQAANATLATVAAGLQSAETPVYQPSELQIVTVPMQTRPTTEPPAGKVFERGAQLPAQVPVNLPARPEPFSPVMPVSPSSPLTPSAPSGGYGTGGAIRVSAGGRVTLGDGARLDASGDLGGGSIMVGGGWQGLNPNIINSQFTYIANTATLYANADLRGNGGLVVVWANDTARIYGRVAARGGALGGDGGSIETSGKRLLDVTQVADASAPEGKGGLWLLDPNNVTIQSAGSDTNVSGNPNFTTNADSAIITIGTIQAALNAGINVTITTSAGGAQNGDITLSNAISKTAGGNATLTLSAHNNININAGISSTSGTLGLVLNANSDAAGGGTATLGSSASLALNGGSITSSNGSALTWSSGTLSGVNLGINATITGSVFIANNLTLSGGAVISIANNANLQYIGNTSISGSGTIDLAGNNAQIYRTNTNTSLTIGSGVTVRATGTNVTSAWLGIYSDETIILSAGSIWNVNNAAKTWYTGNLQNQGTINVSAGGVFLGPYSGSGTFSNNGGTINLSGPTSAYIALGRDNGDTIQSTDLGTINQTGGTAYINGTLALGGNTLNLSSIGLTGLVLNNSGGNPVVTGTAGNLLTANPGFNLSIASGSLSNVNLGTNLAVTGTGYFSGNLGLASGVTVTIGNNANLQYIGNTSISGSGTIDLAGNNAQIYRTNTNTSLTIGSGVTVQATGTNVTSAWLGIYSDETIILSAGSIWNVNNAAKTWYTGNIQNQGAINVSAGALNLGAYSGTGTWSSSSPINLSGGTLTLTDNYTAASMATIVKTGGNLVVSGTLDNTGNTLDIATLAGGVFSGGILGGTIISSNGQALIATSNPIFDGVTLGNASNLNLTINGGIQVKNSITLANDSSINKGNDVWYWITTGAQSLSVAGGGNATLTSSGGYHYAGYGIAGQTLTFASGLTQQGNISIYDSSVATVINNGTINQSLAATTSTITVTNFTNSASGTMSTSAGTTTQSSTNWSNAGTLNVSGGILNLSGTNGTNTGGFNLSGGVLNLGGNLSTPVLGSFTRTGGLVNITGILNNIGQTLDISSAGVFSTGGLNSVSGTILGGTIISSLGQTLVTTSNPIFDGVTLGNASNLNLTINGGIQVKNSITLANGSSINKGNDVWYWITTGAQSLSVAGGGNATLTSSGGYHYAGYGIAGQTLTFASGLTQLGNISIYDSSVATVINNGTLNFNLAGQTATFQPTTFINNGTLTLISGATLTSTSSTSFTNAGTLQTAGTINMGGGTLTNNGILRPGSSPGFTSITGNLVLGAGSTLDIEVTGLTRGVVTGYDSMHVTGTVTLGGTVKVIQSGGFVANVGDLFQIITSGGAMSGSFATVVPPSAPETFVQGTAGKNAFLQRGTVFSGPKVWETDSSGAWTTASNWSGGTVPNASDAVWIDRGPLANPVVSIAGTAVAGKIVASEGITLNSGSLTVNGASNVSGPLTVNGGTFTLNANLDLTGTYSQTGGIVGGAGNLTLKAVSNTWGGSAGSWTGGGTVTVANGATLNLSGSTAGNVFAGHTLNIASGGLVNVAGNIELDPGTNAIVNSGTLNLNSGDIRHTQGSQGTMSISNSGIINKNNAGTFILGASPVAEAVDVTNTGTVNIAAGTLNHAGGTLLQNGTINLLGASTTLLKSGGFTNAGVIAGNGTVNVGGLGTLINAGTIRPDGGGTDLTGTLTVTGNFSQTAGGTLDFQAEGNAAGAYDKLDISGTASLAGTFAFTPASGYVTNNAHTFDVLTCTSATGSFGTTNAPAFASFSPTVGPTKTTFLLPVGCVVDDCWIGTSGDWSVGSNWSTGLAPTAGQRVKISVAGLQTITMTAGTFNLLDVISDENITIAGGNLGISGVFSAPVLNISSGTVGGVGSYTVTSDFNQTGGTFNPSGSIDLTRSLGNFNFGAYTTTGTIRLATVGANDLVLNGSLLSSQAGLADSAAGITLASGRDIKIASTANLTTNTSGAIKLNAAGAIDLKVNDGGGSGATNSLTAAGNLDLSAGTSISRSDGNAVTMNGKSVAMTAGTTIGQTGSPIVATTGGLILSANSTITTDALTATLGAVQINAGAGVSTSAINAGTSVTVGSAAAMTLGNLTASNGLIALTAAGAASDISLLGDVSATNTGLLATQAAISATAGRDLRMASTASMATVTSGGINLNAGGNIDLKVNDGGGSGASNSITAVGNLDLTATAGSISRSDGNTVTLSAANISMTAGSSIGAFGGGITATSGAVGFNAPGSVTFTSVNAAGATGSINITSSAASISGGTLTAGKDVTLTTNSAGGVVLDAITAGTGGSGLINISNSGAGDITLNGTVQTTNPGLASNVAAIAISTGRDIRIKSTTDLIANTSGAIKLTAAGAVDLKVNDGGGSGANNSITAPGNVEITATGGSISRSDGNNFSVAAANVALTAGTSIGAFGGGITANVGNVGFNAPGSVTFDSVNAIGTTSSINIVSSASSISGGTLTAGKDITLTTNSAGGVVLDAITAGTGGSGLINISNSGAGDITLNGTVQTTNPGLASNVAAIAVSTGRDIRIKSTTDLIANTSGAIKLTAAGAVDLKVNDGGGSGANNSITAPGNVEITATGGSISRSDGNNFAVTAANVALTAGTSIGAFGGGIIATVGNVGFNAPGSVNFTSVNATGTTGSINISSTASTVTGGTLTAGKDVTLNTNSIGGVILDSVTAGTGGNGLINISNTGAGDITLQGNLQTTNAGLANNVAAIAVTSGRDIKIKSTTDLAATGTGGITLSAAGSVDLKVNDGGGSGATNSIVATGNVEVIATSGSITRSDGNNALLTGANVNVNAGTVLGGLGGPITATTGNVTLSASQSLAVNSVVASGASGNINITGLSTVTADALLAGSNINVSSANGMTMGTITAGTGGNGVVTLTNNTGGNIALNDQVRATNAALADNSPAINITSAGGISIKSTTNIEAMTSGAVALNAAGVIDLKVNDGGGSGASNSITAPGNINLTGASIIRSDGNAVSATAKVIDVTYTANLDPAISLVPTDSLNVTKTAGDLVVSSSALSARSFNAPGGNVIFSPGTSFTGGAVTVSGSGSAQFNSGSVNFSTPLVTNMPVTVSGATVNIGGSTPQLIAGGAWTVSSGSLTLPPAGATVVAGSSLLVTGGSVGFAVGGSPTLTNGGTVTAGTNLLIPGDFINLAGATANLTANTIGGSLFNSGTFNTGGLVTVNGPQIQQLGGFLNLPGTSSLNMTNNSGVLTWADGTIAGSGTLGFSGGGNFQFGGSGSRVIDGLNFSFNNLTLPSGSLTLKSGSLSLSGTTMLPTGVSLNLSGGTLTNSGVLNVAGTFGLTGGAFAGTGSLNLTGGSLNLPSGNTVAWTNSGALTNTGTLSLAGSTITNAISNQGTINLGSGLTFTQSLLNTGTLAVNAGTTILTGGLTQNTGGSVVLSGGNLQGNLNLSSGTLSGIGNVNGNVTVGNATIAPGASPGAITISGNLVLSPSSNINIELGGLTQGSGYDFLNVLGAASLAGSMNVSSFSGFAAPPSSTYLVMSYGSKTGSFSAINTAAFAGMTSATGVSAIVLTAPAAVVPPPVVVPPVVTPPVVTPPVITPPAVTPPVVTPPVVEVPPTIPPVVEPAPTPVVPVRPLAPVVAGAIPTLVLPKIVGVDALMADLRAAVRPDTRQSEKEPELEACP